MKDVKIKEKKISYNKILNKFYYINFSSLWGLFLIIFQLSIKFSINNIDVVTLYIIRYSFVILSLMSFIQNFRSCGCRSDVALLESDSKYLFVLFLFNMLNIILAFYFW